MAYKRKKGTSISKAKKYTYEGVDYKSGLEMYMAKKLTENYLYFQYEPTRYILQDSFYIDLDTWERQTNGKGEFKNRGGKTIRPITYTVDFVGDNFLCETKGFANEAFPNKFKMFKKLISDNFEGDVLILKPQNRKEVDICIDLILSREVWKSIEGFEGMYEVSSYGRVRSLDRFLINKNGLESKHKGRVLKPFLTGNKNCQYHTVQFEGGKSYKIHRLVANSFLEKSDLDCINHIDENKLNNNVSNLEWISREDDIKYSLSKVVHQYDLEGNFIREFDSTASVVKYGFSQSAVSNCASGKTNTSGGYKWVYKNKKDGKKR